MTISAEQGPRNVFGQATSSDYNPDRGPSFFDQGLGIMDPRSPFIYAPGGQGKTYGWLGVTRIPVLDVVPAALATGAVAAGAHATSGTAMTLVSTSGNGVTVGASVTNAATGASVTGLLAIGGAGGAVAFGQTGYQNIWDPTKMIARALSITGVSGGSGGHFIIKGYDIYGYPMTENINAGAGATTTNGAKAWKYVQSVTPQFTDSSHNYSVDTTDIFGFPMRVDEFGYVEIYNGTTNVLGVLQTLTTGFTAAVTSAATATSGDVRGTFAVQTPSDGTRGLTIFVTPSVANINTAAGLVGVTQF